MARGVLCLLPLVALPMVAAAAPIEVASVRLSVDGVEQSHSLIGADLDDDGRLDESVHLFDRVLLWAFAVGGVSLAADVDPYLATATRMENTGVAPIFFSLNISSLMQPFLPGEGTGSLERFLRLTLEDTNQDGAASFGSPANIFFSVQERSSGLGAQAGGFLTATLTAPGVLTRLDGSEAPLNVFLPQTVLQYDLLRFQLSGTLSAGDSLLVEVFSCFRKGSETCPARPELEPPSVPGPSIAMLLATAVAAMLPCMGRGKRSARP